jgi:hypothetical protein
VLAFGSLTFAMLMLSPVCHQHYLCLLLPIPAGLLVYAWEKPALVWLPRVLTAVLPFVSVAMFLPFIPGLGFLRDHGLPGFAGLLLWIVGCVVLRKDQQIELPAAVTGARVAA